MDFYFFFQAEDGIRDYKVTGVQTCALPIWSLIPPKIGELSPLAARSIMRDWVMSSEIGRATSELQSPCNIVCRLLLEKKKNPSTLFAALWQHQRKTLFLDSDGPDR